MTKYQFIQRLQNCPLTSWLWRYWQHEDTGEPLKLIFWRRPKGCIQISRQEYSIALHGYACKLWSEALLKEMNKPCYAKCFAERTGLITVLSEEKSSVTEKGERHLVGLPLKEFPLLSSGQVSEGIEEELTFFSDSLSIAAAPDYFNADGPRYIADGSRYIADGSRYIAGKSEFGSFENSNRLKKEKDND